MCISFIQSGMHLSLLRYAIILLRLVGLLAHSPMHHFSGHCQFLCHLLLSLLSLLARPFSVARLKSQTMLSEEQGCCSMFASCGNLFLKDHSYKRETKSNFEILQKLLFYSTFFIRHSPTSHLSLTSAWSAYTHLYCCSAGGEALCQSWVICLHSHTENSSFAPSPCIFNTIRSISLSWWVY